MIDTICDDITVIRKSLLRIGVTVIEIQRNLEGTNKKGVQTCGIQGGRDRYQRCQCDEVYYFKKSGSLNKGLVNRNWMFGIIERLDSA
ncbi:MAG TPA: hypothetical protein VK616_19655, partial [Flavitalea sp.]|nr:hypothetical protein [Flavitalea sp.]